MLCIYTINRLDFITEKNFVYCKVRSESVNLIYVSLTRCSRVLQLLKLTVHWATFITTCSDTLDVILYKQAEFIFVKLF